MNLNIYEIINLIIHYRSFKNKLKVPLICKNFLDQVKQDSEAHNQMIKSQKIPKIKQSDMNKLKAHETLSSLLDPKLPILKPNRSTNKIVDYQS